MDTIGIRVGYMIHKIKGNDEGMGTVELVLIIAVLVGLALMFKDTIVGFVTDVLGDISGQQNNFKINNIKNGK